MSAGEEQQKQLQEKQLARVARIEVKSASVVDVSVPEALLVHATEKLVAGWYLETWERMKQVVNVVPGPEEGKLLKRYLTTGLVTPVDQIAGAQWMKLGEWVSFAREASTHPPLGKCVLRWGRFSGVVVVRMEQLPGRAVEEKCAALSTGVVVSMEQLVLGQAVWFPIEEMEE